MPADSNIEWTDATWNPVRGCAVVSPGCTNCYAMKLAHRFSGVGQAYAGLTKLTKGGPVWTGKVSLHHELLDWPLRRRKPSRIFVNSMSDLFHDGVLDEFIDKVFAVMALAPQHTFQILTKRAARMQMYLRNHAARVSALLLHWGDRGGRWWPFEAVKTLRWEEVNRAAVAVFKPLPNVWLGVSVEDQARADERVQLLLQTPAAVRWISAEPLLGPLSIAEYLRVDGCHTFADGQSFPVLCVACGGKGSPRLDWVVVGGESGPGARQFDIAWARSLRDQCKAAGVPYFLKQIGGNTIGWCLGNGHGEPEFYVDCQAYEASECREPCPRGFCGCRLDRKGGDPAEWPEDLRVREYPA